MVKVGKVRNMAAPDLDLLRDNEIRRRARLRRPKWNPRKWHPVYEEVVLLSAMGYKNIEIAERMGYTAVHISNILNTKQAEVILGVIEHRMRNKHIDVKEKSIEERFEALATKAVKRCEDVINDDELAEKSPFGVFDRSIKFLRAVGKIKDPEEEKETRADFRIPVAAAAGIREGLRLAMEVRNRHALPVGESIELQPAMNEDDNQ